MLSIWSRNVEIGFDASWASAQDMVVMRNKIENLTGWWFTQKMATKGISGHQICWFCCHCFCVKHPPGFFKNSNHILCRSQQAIEITINPVLRFQDEMWTLYNSDKLKVSHLVFYLFIFYNNNIIINIINILKFVTNHLIK